MKKSLTKIFSILIIFLVIIVGILVVIRIKDTVISIKADDISSQNEEAEAEYMCEYMTTNLENIIKLIEEDVGESVILAETGTLSDIDIYFLVSVEGEYRYIIKVVEDNEERFEIAQDSSTDGRYIISTNTIGLDKCVYTQSQDYEVDEVGNVTYRKEESI